MSILHDVIIIGAGPAGLTAGLYAGRAKLHTLILEKESIGGELMNRDIIENYPSYPNGIVGPELGSKMMQQAMNYGAEIMPCEVERIEIQNGYNLLKTSGGDFKGKGLIIAGGAHPKKLMVPGEEEFFNRGVFYCAACDGPRYTDKTVVVVGGGDSGMTEALSLSRIASKVTLIEILPHLTGTKILQERVLSHPKIEVQCNVKVDTIRGSNQVEAIDLVDMKTGQKRIIEAEGIFSYIGLEVNTDYLEGIMPLNEVGQIIVNENMETEISGIFAAGDIRHKSPMQIVTAVGDGATAALHLIRYLEKK